MSLKRDDFHWFIFNNFQIHWFGQTNTESLKTLLDFQFPGESVYEIISSVADSAKYNLNLSKANMYMNKWHNLKYLKWEEETMGGGCVCVCSPIYHVEKCYFKQIWKRT